MANSGKGNSSSETKQTAYNQQVATESGIAIGANSQASISVQTSDPEVARTAILGNSAVAGAAFNFAGHSAEIAAETNRLAQAGVERIAGGSILAQSELAGRSIDAQNFLTSKFSTDTANLAAQNISLLQSIGNQQSDIALAGQKLAGDALTQSFAVSRAVAPQDANYSVTELAGTASKLVLYIVLGIAAIFGIIMVTKKRA